MNQKAIGRPAAGMSLGDVYYVLFRHKWKIAAICGLGLAIAAALPAMWPLMYQSEAKLFVHYVVDNKSLSQIGPADAKVTSPDQSGRSVINTELEILTSLDLAQVVATNVGPERVLGKGGSKEPWAAAGLIHANLTAESPQGGSVIRLLFKHRDAAMASVVLN